MRNRKGEYGNETPFSWGPLFHLVVFVLYFGSAFILDSLTRLSVPREEPTDALNRFAEYLVSNIGKEVCMLGSMVFYSGSSYTFQWTAQEDAKFFCI